MWAYWAEGHKYLHSGKVTAVGAENLNVHTVSFWVPVVGRLILYAGNFMETCGIVMIPHSEEYEQCLPTSDVVVPVV